MSTKHKHRPCPCGCGELADECMSPSSGLGAFQITEPASLPCSRYCPFVQGCEACIWRGGTDPKEDDD